MDIVQFINDRLDEDEAVARKAIEGYRSGEWEMRYPFAAVSGVYVVGEEDGYVTFDQEGLSDLVGTDGIGHHIARHDPARVLREVEAKRRIVDEHATVDPCDAHDGATLETVTCDTLLALASVYSDHPDYDPEWR